MNRTYIITYEDDPAQLINAESGDEAALIFALNLTRDENVKNFLKNHDVADYDEAFKELLRHEYLFAKWQTRIARTMDHSVLTMSMETVKPDMLAMYNRLKDEIDLSVPV